MASTTRREMSVTEKGIILVLFHLEYKISYISKVSGRPWSTVKNFLNRTKIRGTINNLPRSGRPPKLSKRDRRLILHTVKTNRAWTNEKVLQECCPHASLSTLSRFLSENGMRKWIAKRRPKLTDERAAKRLAWALERKDWSAEQFQTTIWSDECTIEKSTQARQTWVFRTPDEKWEKDCIMAVKKGNGVSVMVWGCFWGKQKGTFVPFIVKSVNAKIYLRILETLVLPVIEHINSTIAGPNSGLEARFQQDNAPVHKAKVISHFFQNNKIPVDNHPPYSPDLNPIEHVWVHLKRQLHRKHPDIATTPGGPDRVRARLIEVLPEVWDSLPESIFERLWQSMPDRVAAVIAAKGWYTRY